MQHSGVSFFARWLPKAWAGSPKLPFDAGLAALDRRQFDAALAHFAQALNAASSAAAQAAIHNKRGIAQLGRGDRAAAAAAFADALIADWRFVPVIVNIGNLLFEDGALDEAVEHYEAALKIDDAYPTAHLNLGVAYKKLGRRGDAVRELRRASQLEARLRRRRP